MTGHTFQFGTIAQLRKIYETNLAEVEKVGERLQFLLRSVGSHAALARDAALLLDQTDPEWTAECEAPVIARTLRLRAWREMIDFLEAHPEIGISDYESLTLRQPDGQAATPEWLESLEQIGIAVERSETRVRAELWFGDHAVELRGYAKIEPPAEIEPAKPFDKATPAEVAEAYERTTDSHQQLAATRPAAGTRVRVVKDLVEGDTFLGRQGTVIEPHSNDGAIAVQLFGNDGTIGFADDELETLAPIQVGDRIRVHAAPADDDQAYEFPGEFEGRDGTVTAVRDDAFAGEQDTTSDPDDRPIDVLLDGEVDVNCFTAAEIDVLSPAEDVRVGVPA